MRLVVKSETGGMDRSFVKNRRLCYLKSGVALVLRFFSLGRVFGNWTVFAR